MSTFLATLKNFYLIGTFVFADKTLDGSKAVQGLTDIKNVLITIVAVIGAIIVVKNLMDFATGIQDRDSSSISSGIRGMVAGGLMAAGSVIVGMFT
jgi:hypothetical protein